MNPSPTKNKIKTKTKHVTLVLFLAFVAVLSVLVFGWPTDPAGPAQAPQRSYVVTER